MGSVEEAHPDEVKLLEEQLRAVVAELAQRLTKGDVDEIIELIDANELGVAFECLCTQLFERDATCSPDQSTRIASIGSAMGIGSDYWEILAVE